jgi:FxsC-like protein
MNSDDKLRVFVSYRTDDNFGRRRRISELVEDLKEEVVRIGPYQRDDVDFFFADEKLRGGALWEEQIVDFLRCCHIFVPIYSPGYFYRKWCAREYGYFKDRLRRAEGGYTTPPEFIIPINWITTDVPAEVTDVQYSDRLHPHYQEKGMDSLSGADRYNVINSVAQKIVQVTWDRKTHEKKDWLPCDLDRPDLTKQPPAFKVRNWPKPEPKPWKCHLVKALMSRQEVKASNSTNGLCLRTEDALESYYHENADGWAPYREGTNNSYSMVDVLRTLMGQNRLDQQRAFNICTQPASGTWKQAIQRRELFLLLVDPWLTGIKSVQDRLLELKPNRKGELPAFVVLLPQHDKDPDLSTRHDEVDAAVDHAFHERIRADPKFFLRRLHTLDEFRDQVRMAIRDVRAGAPANPTV